MKKKFLIAIAAVILIAAVTLAVLTIFGNQKEIPFEDPDSKYGYTLKHEGKDIVVRISGEVPEGYKWICSVSDEETAGIAEKSVKKTKEKTETVFTVSPGEPGVTDAVFSLVKDSDKDDVLYELIMNFVLDPDGRFLFTGGTHRESLGKSVFNENGLHPYSFYENKDGYLTVRIENTGSAYWEPLADSTEFINLREYPEEGAAVIVIRPVKEGTAKITVTEDGGKGVLTLSVRVDENLGTVITEHSIKE